VSALQFREQVSRVFVLKPPADHLGPLGRVSHLLAEGKRLRQDHGVFDAAYALPNSLSAAVLLWGAGARQRIGYATEGRSLFLTNRRNWKKLGSGVHRAQAYVKLLGEPPVSPDPPKSEPVARFDAEREWPEAKPIAPPTGNYWVLAPGATADSRRWDAASFLALARKITQTLGARGVIVGGPKEAPLSDRLREDRELGLLDYTARGSVADLWSLFRGAKLTVSNESGLAHVASLLGSPVQIVCGAADPRRTRPVGPGSVQVAFNPVDCWPCEKNHCSRPPGEEYLCLRGITPERVWEDIERGFRLADPD